MKKVIVIGAGIGGLTTAALLLQAGLEVTVLEAHVDPGGSAATFFHQGYRFDAGATLAGGFAPGGPHARIASLLGLEWPVQPVDPAWVVHLPDRQVTQWADPAAWQAERQRAFPGMEAFWERQERLARAAWEISSRSFPWPPARPADLLELARALSPSALRAAPYGLLKAAHLVPPGASCEFWAFLDAQLIISAQAGAHQANALYACAALDLPRRGVKTVRGGMGSLAGALAEWVNRHGGQILYRQKVERLDVQRGRVIGLETAKGLQLRADGFVANLTPRALQSLLITHMSPVSIQHRALPAQIPTLSPAGARWGAFTLYLGLELEGLPANIPDHHQVIVDSAQPPGEGNTVFISLSDLNDPWRAPAGRRSATLSTHTSVESWWRLAQTDRPAYEARKQGYTARLLDAAERAIPGLRRSIRLCLPGTPLTFEAFTHRPLGLVGGTPQVSLLQARSPVTALPNLWLVGDSIFPGQSTAGVTIGALRVASLVLARYFHR